MNSICSLVFILLKNICVCPNVRLLSNTLLEISINVGWKTKIKSNSINQRQYLVTVVGIFADFCNCHVHIMGKGLCQQPDLVALYAPCSNVSVIWWSQVTITEITTYHHTAKNKWDSAQKSNPWLIIGISHDISSRERVRTLLDMRSCSVSIFRC